MSPSAIDFLKRLGSGVLPEGLTGSAPTAGPGSIGFAELLSRAGAGELRTGLPVTVEPGSGIELSAEQLERLSQAADKADAAGARRAVVLMDGVAFEMDVPGRRVLGLADLSGVQTGVDAVLRAPGANGEGTAASSPALAPPPSGVLSSASLRELLAG